MEDGKCTDSLALQVYIYIMCDELLFDLAAPITYNSTACGIYPRVLRTEYVCIYGAGIKHRW